MALATGNLCIRFPNAFHNIPARLSKAAEGTLSYQEVLAEVLEESKRFGAFEWVESQVREMRLDRR